MSNIQNVGESMATKAGATIAVGGGVSAFVNEHAVLISLAFAAGGFLLALGGFYFQCQRRKEEKALFEKRMKELDSK